MTAAAQYDQLIASLYSAPLTLVAAVSDPVAIEQASLRHRASALNAVSTLLGRLSNLKPPVPADWNGEIKWIFGDEDDIEPAAPQPNPPAAASASAGADRPAAPMPEPISYDRALELTIRGARFDDGRTPFVYADEIPDSGHPSRHWPEPIDTRAG